jgi:hypothetical protein|tara:strand:- start:336 stop:929 length:594 start_codon:yes stop_codon:yes gene_type:complete
MSSRKSFTQKKREERIQKNLEKMGAPPKPPKAKTLRQVAKKQLERARLIQQFPFSSTDKKEGTIMDLAGFPPATEEERMTAMLKGTRGLYKEKIPKELRDRIKYESKSKVKKKKGGGLMTAINRVKKEQGVKGMMRGGLSGGNPSGPPRRMVADPALIKPLNPGKLIDVTEMAKGGFMDEEIEKRMMGGYMEYKEDK